MRMQCHKKLYCTGHNDKIKSRRKLKFWRNPEMSEIKATENFYDYCMLYFIKFYLHILSMPSAPTVHNN